MRTNIIGYKVVTLEDGTRESAFDETSLHKMKLTCGKEEWEVNEECAEIEYKMERLEEWNRLEASLDGCDNGNYKNRKR